MKPFHLKRLLKLADFLEKLPRKQFDICEIASKDEACGTVACVAGWAGFVPAFRRAGLKMVDEGKSSGKLSLMVNGVVKDNLLGAVAMFLGLSWRDEADLFWPSGYDKANVTPKDAAKKIRRLVAAKKKERTAKP